MKLNDRQIAAILQALIYLTKELPDLAKLLARERAGDVLFGSSRLGADIEEFLAVAQQELNIRGNYFQYAQRNNSGMQFFLGRFPQSPKDLTITTTIVTELVFIILANIKTMRSSWPAAEESAFNAAEKEFLEFHDWYQDRGQQAAGGQGEQLDFGLVATIILTVLEKMETPNKNNARYVEAWRQELIELIESSQEKQECNDTR